MKDAEKLVELVAKYKKNREAVPLEELRTKYRGPYEKLKAQIKAEAEAQLVKIAAAMPDWMPEKAPEADVLEIAGAFNQIYEAGNYSKRIGAAIFKRYDLEEAEGIAKEINGKFTEAIGQIFEARCCLYITAENCDKENPAYPQIYNSLVDKFWSDEAGGWIQKEKPEGEAVLLYISSKEK